MKEVASEKNPSKMKDSFCLNDDEEDDYIPCTDISERLGIIPEEQFVIVGDNSGMRSKLFEDSYNKCSEVLEDILNGFDESGTPMENCSFTIISKEEWEALQ